MLIFVYKTKAFLMVLKKQCSTDIENTEFMKIMKSLSPYACAAKSLYQWSTHNTSTQNMNP